MLAQTGTGIGDFGLRYFVMWFGLPLSAIVAAVLTWRAIQARRLDGQRAAVIGLWVASPYLLLMWLRGPHFLGYVLMYAVTGEAGGYVWAAPSIVLGIVVSLTLAWKLVTQRRRS